MSRVQDGVSIGSDLKLAEYILGADLQVNGSGDMDTISEEMNLAQAILHRIRTVRGELAELGHPEYGSTVLDFVGQANDWTTRERLRLAIRDTIRQERRVKEIVSITVKSRMETLAAIKGNDSITTNKKDSSLGGAIKGLSLETQLDEEGKAVTGKKSGIDDEDNDNAAESFESLSNQQLFPASTDIMNSVDIDIVIIPQGRQNPLQIAFPFKLEVS